MYKQIENKYFNIAIIVVGLLIAGSIAFYSWQVKDGFDGEVLSLEEASNKSVDYINQNFLDENNKAELKGTSEEKGLYKLKLEINGQEQETYVTKDAKIIFPTAIKATSTENTESNEEDTDSSQSNADIPKSEKPEVDLYVMSFCPYGNQAEDTMEPVYDLLGDRIDFNVHYIVNEDNGELSSLHGQKEIDQNMREACVLKNNGMGKWWDFTTYVNENCGSEGECWQEAAQSNNLNTNTIQTCIDRDGLELMKDNAQISSENNVSGSPTMMINGVESRAVYDYGNPNEYKEEICSAFEEEDKIEQCSEELEPLEGSNSDGGSC
ncbi:MAG: DsbA family protein [Minisyncoccales bacterium]